MSTGTTNTSAGTPIVAEKKDATAGDSTCHVTATSTGTSEAKSDSDLAPKSTTQSLSDEPNGSQTSDGLLRVTAEEEDAHAKAMEVYKDIVSVCASAKSHEQYIINQTQRYYRMRSDSAIEKLLGNQG